MTAQHPPDPLEFELSFSQALSRAFRVRCPYCGSGRLFSGLLRMNSSCSVCGTRLEREPGYFLARPTSTTESLPDSTTLSLRVAALRAGLVQQRTHASLMSFCLIFPLIFFRYARSLWLALDCFFDRQGARQGDPELAAIGKPG